MKKIFKFFLATVLALSVAGCPTDTGSDDTPTESAKKYTITIAATQNGSVTADRTTDLTEGTEVTLTATPDSGYKLGTLKVNNADVTVDATVTGSITHKFKMPAANITVSATFDATTPPPATKHVLTYMIGTAVDSTADVTADTEFTLKTMTKTGYTFSGWFETDACTGTAITTVTLTDGDKTVYGKWTEITIDASKLTTAPLAHHGETVIEQKDLVSTYTLSASYDEGTKKYSIDLTADQLVRHTNGEDTGTTAYWVGVAIPKLAAGQKVRTYYEGNKNPGSFEDADIEWTDDEDNKYNTFYFGSYDGSFAKKGYIEISNDGLTAAKTCEITFHVMPRQIIYAAISHTAQDIVQFYKDSAQNALSGWNSYYFSIVSNEGKVTYANDGATIAGTGEEGDYYSDENVTEIDQADESIETTLEGKTILFEAGNCVTYIKHPWPLLFIDKGAVLAGSDKSATDICAMKNIKVSYKINNVANWVETECDDLNAETVYNAITLSFDHVKTKGIAITDLKTNDTIQLKFELYDGSGDTAHKIAEVVTEAYTAVTSIELDHSDD